MGSLAGSLSSCMFSSWLLLLLVGLMAAHARARERLSYGRSRARARRVGQFVCLQAKPRATCVCLAHLAAAQVTQRSASFNCCCCCCCLAAVGSRPKARSSSRPSAARCMRRRLHVEARARAHDFAARAQIECALRSAVALLAAAAAEAASMHMNDPIYQRNKSAGQVSARSA